MIMYLDNGLESAKVLKSVATSTGAQNPCNPYVQHSVCVCVCVRDTISGPHRKFEST